MTNPFGKYGILNPFKSNHAYSSGMEGSAYYYEEDGLKTTFATADELTAYMEKRDAEVRNSKILTALAVLLILAGLWVAFKKK